MRIVAIVLALVLVASAALAGVGHNPVHKIAIHIKSHPTSCTENYPTFPDCVSIQHTYSGCGDIDVMPVFYDLIEFTAVEFGLTWWLDPSLSMVWTRCLGDAAVGTIVQSGDGTAITWGACQHSYSVAPGYGWLSVTGQEIMYPDHNPETLRCGVIDCQASPGPYFDYALQYSAGGICGILGDDPCMPVGVRQSTWGAIKVLVR